MNDSMETVPPGILAHGLLFSLQQRIDKTPLNNKSENDKELVMTKRIIFSLLALALIGSPAAAQNQSLTSFKDSVGDHIYYQHDGSSGGPNNLDLFQIAPTLPWSGDMNQLSRGCNTPPELGFWPPAGSPLASFTDGFGQHVLYLDNKMHVRDLEYNGSCSNLDLTALASLLPPLPPSDGMSLAAFSDASGEHAYYTAVDGHIHHLLYLGRAVMAHQDLTAMAGLTVSSPCGNRMGPLTAFADARSQPTIELVYYVGSDDLCELAWYQGREQSFDLTAMCGGGCGSGAPHPLVVNVLADSFGGPLSGFADAGGQNVFYLDNAQHVHQFLAGPNGLSTMDLTDAFDGNPAVADSLTSFSNAFGAQVFYVDASQHVNQIRFFPLIAQVTPSPGGVHQDLTALFGGALTLPARQTPCAPAVASPGTSLSSISFDDKKGEDVFYVGTDRHVWELHSSDGFTWSSFDLTLNYGGTATFGTVTAAPCGIIG